MTRDQIEEFVRGALKPLSWYVVRHDALAEEAAIEVIANMWLSDVEKDIERMPQRCNELVNDTRDDTCYHE